MGNRSHRVAVIVQAIANIAFFTVHGTMRITHQPELGRTSTESNCFRMHPDDYVTSLSSSHSFDSGTQMVVASRPIGACIEVDRRRFIKSSLVTGSALLGNRGFAVRIPSSQEPVAGAVALVEHNNPTCDPQTKTSTLLAFGEPKARRLTKLLKEMAPQVGLEPTTLRLTASWDPANSTTSRRR
jgi:hypothetical protein